MPARGYGAKRTDERPSCGVLSIGEALHQDTCAGPSAGGVRKRASIAWPYVQQLLRGASRSRISGCSVAVPGIGNAPPHEPAKAPDCDDRALFFGPFDSKVLAQFAVREGELVDTDNCTGSAQQE